MTRFCPACGPGLWGVAGQKRVVLLWVVSWWFWCWGFLGLRFVWLLLLGGRWGCRFVGCRGVWVCLGWFLG